MKLLFQMIKPRENIISRAVHGITKQKYSGGRFAENQFKELMKKNLSVPVTLYHL